MSKPPTLPSPEVTDALCKTLRTGVDRETACKREGISRSMFYRWMHAGSQDDAQQPYKGFVEAIERAEAEVEGEVTQGILRAAKDNWQAGAWWLKWRRTGGRETIEVTGANGQPLGVITGQTAEQIRRTILFGESPDTPAGALPGDPAKALPTPKGDDGE